MSAPVGSASAGGAENSTAGPSATAAADALAVEFVEPLPGFDQDSAFTLSAIDPNGLLLSLRSARDPSLRFVLTPSDCFFDDYRPELAPVITDSLGEPVQVLLVLSIGNDLTDATANLRAPIVVSTGTGKAMQVILDDDSLPMRRPLIAA